AGREGNRPRARHRAPIDCAAQRSDRVRLQAGAHGIHRETSRVECDAVSATEPVILLVDDDPQVLAAIRRDMRLRYRDGYRVLAANGGEAALEAINEIKARGDALAMVISDQRMPSMSGTELLTRCREIYPVARRVLLTAYSDIKAAVCAINEAHLDHYLEKPWDPPEERLYPAVDDLLSSWQAEYRPEITGLRLIGYPWSPRSHEVKDFLAGNLIPYRWFDIERDHEARRLLEAAGAQIEE